MKKDIATKLATEIENKTRKGLIDSVKKAFVEKYEELEKAPNKIVNKKPVRVCSNHYFYCVFRKKYRLKLYMNPITFSVSFIVPANGVYTIILDNYTVAIGLITDKSGPNPDKYNINEYSMMSTVYIVGKNCHKWHNRFMRMNITFVRKYFEHKNDPHLLCIGPSYYQPTKSMDEIIMMDDNRNRISLALDQFINNKKFYTENNIKYRLGILLYGPTGTGKTELAKAIALKLRRPARILTSSIIRTTLDNGTSSTFKHYENNVIIFDEIDGLSKVHELSENFVSREELLKFIDDMPDDTIVIATTNCYNDLDKSLIRPGRFDIKINMDFFDKKEAYEMCDLHQVDHSVADNLGYPICPSSLQFEIIMKKYERILEIIKKGKNA